MKIICVGLNYADHAAEIGMERQQDPPLFLKTDSSILKNNKPFFIPEFASQVDYEIELVIRISKVGRSVAERFAHRYWDAITVGLDFTARDLHTELRENGLSWEISKAFDGSAPLGKFVNKAELRNPENIEFWLDRNGARVQHGLSKQMILGFDQIISFVSKYFTLKTGDLIFTGTPPGVGPVSYNDRLTGYLEGRKLLDMNIK